MAYVKQDSNYLSKYEPRAKMPCLCGSGQKFKHCCSDEYDAPVKNGLYDDYNSGHYGEALRKCRLSITWYILCHKAHTIPFLESDSKESQELLQLDIYALSDIVEFLLSCYEQTGKHKQFPQALDALQNAITDTRWYDRIAYFRALWQLYNESENSLIYHELKKISDLENTTDLDVLTLYLEVCPEKSFSKRIEIIERILATNPLPTILLQYQTFKGVQYYLMKNLDSAKNIVSKAIEKFKSECPSKLGTYDYLTLAQALYILGELTNNETHFVEARSYLLKTLASKNLKPAGVAFVYNKIGYSLLFEGKPSEAKDYFNKSLELNDDEITKVFLSRAFSDLKEFEKAEDVLSSINVEKMDEREQYDFAVAWTELALETKRSDLLIKAESTLNTIVAEGYLFDEMKDELLSEVQRALSDSDNRIMPKIVKHLKNYLLLQPNFYGLGVNINKILEDAGRKIEGKKKL